MNARDPAFDRGGPDESGRARSVSPQQRQQQRQRQQYTLAEKLAIVRESQQAGISQASISRKYRLGKNVLWGWRKSLSSVHPGLLQGGSGESSPDLESLRERIAELERLLGQKTFEIELLRDRLQNTRLQGAHAGASTVKPD